jgi:hypothetical protein
MRVETIFRARKIDSNEWVEGILLPNLKRFKNKSFMINEYTRMKDLDNAKEIDIKTLSVHYTNSNMNDSEGNRIFASLSSDGNGGDILSEQNQSVRYCAKTTAKFTCILQDQKIAILDNYINCSNDCDFSDENNMLFEGSRKQDEYIRVIELGYEVNQFKATGIHTIEGE